MQISSAASTVLNAAAPVAVVAGLGGGSASDTASPFADMLQSVQQGAPLGATSAEGGRPQAALDAVPAMQVGASSATVADTGQGIVAQPPARSTIVSVKASSIQVSGVAADFAATVATANGAETNPGQLQTSQMLTASPANAATDATSAGSPARKPAKTAQTKDASEGSLDAPAIEPLLVPIPLVVAALPAPAPAQPTPPTTLAAASTSTTSATLSVPPSAASPSSPTGSLSPVQAVDDDVEASPSATPAVSTAPLSAGALAAKATEPRAVPAPVADASPASPASGSVQLAATAAPAVQSSSDQTVSAPPAAAPQPLQPVLQVSSAASAQAAAAPRPTAAERPASASPGRFRATSTSGASDGKSAAVSGKASAAATVGSAVADVQQGSSAQEAAVAVAGADQRTADPDDATPDQSASDASMAAQAGFGATLPTAVETTPASAAPTTTDVSTTVANLSAQIAQKAGGQSTRFDVQLDPMGLGRVNVSVEIDAKGAVSAALSFEKPEAASLLRAHASDLQQSLAQAGFNLPDGALSFSTVAQSGPGSADQTAWLGAGAGDGGQQFQNGQSQNGQAQNAGRAFGAAGFAADQADQIATASRTFSVRGLDIRI